MVLIMQNLFSRFSQPKPDKGHKLTKMELVEFKEMIDTMNQNNPQLNQKQLLEQALESSNKGLASLTLKDKVFLTKDVVLNQPLEKTTSIDKQSQKDIRAERFNLTSEQSAMVKLGHVDQLEKLLSDFSSEDIAPYMRQDRSGALFDVMVSMQSQKHGLAEQEYINLTDSQLGFLHRLEENTLSSDDKELIGAGDNQLDTIDALRQVKIKEICKSCRITAEQYHDLNTKQLEAIQVARSRITDMDTAGTGLLTDGKILAIKDTTIETILDMKKGELLNTIQSAHTGPTVPQHRAAPPPLERTNASLRNAPPSMPMKDYDSADIYGTMSKPKLNAEQQQKLNTAEKNMSQELDAIDADAPPLPSKGYQNETPLPDYGQGLNEDDMMTVTRNHGNQDTTQKIATKLNVSTQYLNELMQYFEIDISEISERANQGHHINTIYENFYSDMLADRLDVSRDVIDDLIVEYQCSLDEIHALVEKGYDFDAVEGAIEFDDLGDIQEQEATQQPVMQSMMQELQSVQQQKMQSTPEVPDRAGKETAKKSLQERQDAAKAKLDERRAQWEQNPEQQAEREKFQQFEQQEQRVIDLNQLPLPPDEILNDRSSMSSPNIHDLPPPPSEQELKDVLGNIDLSAVAKSTTSQSCSKNAEPPNGIASNEQVASMGVC